MSRFIWQADNKNCSFPSWQYVIFVITTFPDMRQAAILYECSNI